MLSRALLVPVGVIILLAVGGYAYAEDVAPATPADPAVPADAMAPAEGQPVDGMNEGATIEGAIEETSPYEEEYEEDFRERYFRLTRDFINPQALGIGSIGRVPAWSQGILRAGPFRYTPFLEVSAGWSSNIFLDEGDDDDPITRDQDERSSSYWQVRTGLIGDARFFKDRLTFRSVIEALYRDHTRGSAADDWEGTFGLSGRYDFPIGFWVELGVTWYHLFDPIDQEDVPTRMERDTVDYSIDVGLDRALSRVFGGKLEISIGADVSTHNFHDHAYKMGDRQEVSAYIKVAYNVVRELNAFIRYEHGFTHAFSHRLNDGENSKIDVGLDGAYPITKSGRLLGTVFFGFRTDRFDDAEIYRVGSDRISTDTDDKKDDFHGGLQLRYLLGTRTTLSALYVHDTEFSLRGNYQTVDRLDLTGNYIVTRDLIVRAAVFGEIAQPSAVDDVYRYGWGVGGRYKISDIVDVGLSYDGRVRVDTDINGSDYIDHQVELSLTFHLR